MIEDLRKIIVDMRANGLSLNTLIRIVKEMYRTK